MRNFVFLIVVGVCNVCGGNAYADLSEVQSVICSGQDQDRNTIQFFGDFLREQNDVDPVPIPEAQFLELIIFSEDVDLYEPSILLDNMQLYGGQYLFAKKSDDQARPTSLEVTFKESFKGSFQLSYTDPWWKVFRVSGDCALVQSS
jgi:hypothetical protein